MVTEYLERPCAKYPKGRKIVIANGRQIFKEEPYPCAAYGFDGICLHPLTFTVDPDSDRDRGMVIHMLDAQRTYNNCTNQQIAWAQLALNPQIIGPPMANKIKFTDEPGAYYTVVPINGMAAVATGPADPARAFEMKEEAKLDMQLIAGSDDIPDNVEAAKAMQVAIEQSRSAVAELPSGRGGLPFRADAPLPHARTGVLHGAALLAIRGRFGWENIEDFKGADIRDQTDVGAARVDRAPHPPER
jgi:hypothetical protein